LEKLDTIRKASAKERGTSNAISLALLAYYWWGQLAALRRDSKNLGEIPGQLVSPLSGHFECPSKLSF
jgi:hypothetical protein